MYAKTSLASSAKPTNTHVGLTTTAHTIQNTTMDVAKKNTTTCNLVGHSPLHAYTTTTRISHRLVAWYHLYCLPRGLDVQAIGEELLASSGSINTFFHPLTLDTVTTLHRHNNPQTQCMNSNTRELVMVHSSPWSSVFFHCFTHASFQMQQCV